MHIFKVGILQTLEKYFFLSIGTFQVWSMVLGYLINIWQMSRQSHDLNHDQSKHSTENFISQNLFKIH